MSIVTIVTRTKDRPVLLARAIKSVLGQSHQEWEHVIVNDGGNREAVDKLVAKHQKAYGDRVRVNHLEASVGMQRAANEGVAAGSGTFVCIHDDDDSWARGYLGAAVAFLKEKGPDSAYQGVISHSELIEEHIGPRGKITRKDRRPYIPLSEISLFRLGFENPFPPIAFCFRRRAYETIGPFDPRFNVAGDYDFNFRFLRQFEIGVIDKVLAHYHIRVDPRNAAESNSVERAAREHKIRYNELKNHYLREADSDRDAALALAFNVARYLVEIEWATHEARERARALQETVDQSFQAIDERLGVSEKRIEESLAPGATREFREHLLTRLEALTERSEAHAANLWKDLNARTRETAEAIEARGRETTEAIEARSQETAAAIARLEAALLARHDQVRTIVEEITGGTARETNLQTLRERLEELSAQAGQESTLQAIAGRQDDLAKNLKTTGRDLWTDLNARSRETIGAIETQATQHTHDLSKLSHEIKQLAAALGRQEETAAQSNAELTHRIEALSQKTTTLQTELECEREARKSLFSLGRFALSWKRSPTSSDSAPAPEA